MSGGEGSKVCLTIHDLLTESCKLSDGLLLGALSDLFAFRVLPTGSSEERKERREERRRGGERECRRVRLAQPRLFDCS